jgi:hypothetical protein
MTEARRAARRAAMPITAAFVEQYAEFMPTLIYAVENGHTYGKPPTDESVFDIPPNYAPMQSYAKVKKC